MRQSQNKLSNAFRSKDPIPKALTPDYAVNPIMENVVDILHSILPLKFVSAIFYQIYIFHQTIALQKL